MNSSEIIKNLSGIHSPSNYQKIIHGLRAALFLALALILMSVLKFSDLLALIIQVSFIFLSVLIGYLDTKYILSKYEFSEKGVTCHTFKPFKSWQIFNEDIKTIEIENIIGGRNLKIKYGSNLVKRILFTNSMKKLII